MGQIIIGLSPFNTLADIRKYSESGVTEFFIGYLPSYWTDKYDYFISANRREFPGYHYTEIKDLKEVFLTIHQNNAKGYITLNANILIDDQTPLIKRMLEELLLIDIDGVIIADLGLVLQLNEWKFNIPIHISGEAGCNSSYNIRSLKKTNHNIQRIIFPRNQLLSEIKEIISSTQDLGLEYEAFIMSQRCVYNSEFCTTFHGRGFFQDHFCHEQKHKYFYKRFDKDIIDRIKAIKLQNMSNPEWNALIDQTRISTKDYIAWYDNEGYWQLWHSNSIDSNPSITSRRMLISECGLCAIRSMIEAKVDSYKIVSRGDNTHHTLMRVELVKKILDGPDRSVGFCKSLINDNSICDSGFKCLYRDFA